MKKVALAGLGIALLATSGLVVQASSALTAPDPSTARDPSLVHTSGGVVRGTVGSRVRSFQGIPYAKAARFAAPRPADRWRGVRDTTKPGKWCAQPAGLPIGKPSTDEDCLNLNVTTPVGKSGKRPVIVWVHGGSMMFGMGHLYGPDRLAADGAIVVSMNYRLGATSFLTHPGLPDSGGLAQEDQRAALRWVRQNIARFGGDASNVTLMGESGGGYSVCGHLASPASKGLFQRAIIQSAPCGAPGGASRTRAEARAESNKVIGKTRCATVSDVADCLRKLPIEDLLAAYGTHREPRPVSGTRSLPLPVDQALRKGRINRVPVLVGVNHDEENGMILGQELATHKPMPANAYEPAVRQEFGRRADAVLRRYPLGSSAGRTLAKVKTDAIWSVPTLNTARVLSRWTPTRMYEFADQKTPWFKDTATPSFPPAAQHMAELPYLFDLALFERLSDGQAALGNRMIGAWRRFAATGDPNGAGETAWPRLTDSQGRTGWHVQSLTRGTWKRADFLKDHHYRFWNTGSR
ncbi:carboxylesterase/lipase family protein [Streptomyces sp. 8N114]|uniref:carboxylesterase/lipase family protein n=1 Tax=Streptomyces sp. 8N114 TaxID=3457419 RepID=UPI003FD294B5